MKKDTNLETSCNICVSEYNFYIRPIFFLNLKFTEEVCKCNMIMFANFE